MCIESRKPPLGYFITSESYDRGGDSERGDAEVMGSGVVATDGIVVLGASVRGLPLNIREQFWGRCIPSVFSILDTSVSRFNSETGAK